MAQVVPVLLLTCGDAAESASARAKRRQTRRGGARVTCYSRSTHQVCVGEVQGGVELEVGLDNPPRSLTGVVEEASALHGHPALVAILQGRRDTVEHV